MKKILIISLFVLGLIIPNINVKAVDVSNEEELRAAIEQGGNITLTQNIEIKEPLVIDKDVTISGQWLYYILMQGDDTLITVNSGNVTLNSVTLYAGWNGKYNEWGKPDNVVKNQGAGLVVNGGSVNFKNNPEINAGNIGLEVNDGTITGNPVIYVGENTKNGFLGGNAIIANGGTLNLYGSGNIEATSAFNNIESGNVAITIEQGTIVNLYGHAKQNPTYLIDLHIISDQENAIEVNEGGTINITNSVLSGQKNALYLNGGTANLSNVVALSSSEDGYSIYMNKGINSNTGKESLVLKDNFIFGTSFYIAYIMDTSTSYSIYVNPNITELRITDEKEFFRLENNKIKLDFCSNNRSASNIGNNTSLCTNLNANYDGPIYSNELDKCTTVYINGVKQNEPDASCNPVAEDENTENNQGPQIVEVPSTSAYGSIIIIVLGIICVIVSVFVMRKMTKKAN